MTRWEKIKETAAFAAFVTIVTLALWLVGGMDDI